MNVGEYLFPPTPPRLPLYSPIPPYWKPCHHPHQWSSNNYLQCWGKNDYGQLGLGDTEQRGGLTEAGYPFGMGDSLPTVDVGTNLTVESLSLGSGHACAVLIGGHLKVRNVHQVESETVGLF